MVSRGDGRAKWAPANVDENRPWEQLRGASAEVMSIPRKLFVVQIKAARGVLVRIW
jgi:hypothetical protein